MDGTDKKDAHAIRDVHIDVHIHLRLLGNAGENKNLEVSCVWKRNNEVGRGGEFGPELTMNSKIRIRDEFEV